MRSDRPAKRTSTVTLKRRVLKRQLTQAAEGYLELGMAEHTLESLAALEASQGLDGHALYLRGEALRWLKRHEEATDCLRKSASLLPEELHVWLALAWCYKRIDQISSAIDALEKALQVDSNEAILYYNLACYWSLAGNKRQALIHLARALDIDEEYRELIADESDFDSIRNDPDFVNLTSVIV